MKYMHTRAVRFKRTETGQKSTGWEVGIGIGPNPDAVDLIVDSNARPVPFPVYDFHNIFHAGCFSIEVVQPKEESLSKEKA